MSVLMLSYPLKANIDLKFIQNFKHLTTIVNDRCKLIAINTSRDYF